MTLKRLAAFLLAAAMVVGALLIRNALDGNSDTGTASPGDPPSGDNSFQLICSSEFQEVCNSIASDKDNQNKLTVTIEPAGVTLDRLAKATDDQMPDAWLTLDPFPAMLDETRDRTTSFGPATTTTQVLSTTASAVAVIDAKAGALQESCAEESIATCVGRLAGKTWADVGDPSLGGSLKLGISDPATEASGLLSFADGMAGLLGTTDIDSGQYSDPDVRAWVRNIVANSQTFPAGSALNTMISRPSKVDVAYTTSVETTASPSGSREPYQSLAVSPGFTVAATWAVIASNDDRLRDQTAEALISAGWISQAEDSPTLSASTFITLRALWEDT